MTHQVLITVADSSDSFHRNGTVDISDILSKRRNHARHDTGTALNSITDVLTS